MTLLQRSSSPLLPIDLTTRRLQNNRLPVVPDPRAAPVLSPPPPKQCRATTTLLVDSDDATVDGDAIAPAQGSRDEDVDLGDPLEEMMEDDGLGRAPRDRASSPVWDGEGGGGGRGWRDDDDDDVDDRNGMMEADGDEDYSGSMPRMKAATTQTETFHERSIRALPEDILEAAAQDNLTLPPIEIFTDEALERAAARRGACGSDTCKHRQRAPKKRGSAATVGPDRDRDLDRGGRVLFMSNLEREAQERWAEDVVGDTLGGAVGRGKGAMSFVTMDQMALGREVFEPLFKEHVKGMEGIVGDVRRLGEEVRTVLAEHAERNAEMVRRSAQNTKEASYGKHITSRLAQLEKKLDSVEGGASKGINALMDSVNLLASNLDRVTEVFTASLTSLREDNNRHFVEMNLKLQSRQQQLITAPLSPPPKHLRNQGCDPMPAPPPTVSDDRSGPSPASAAAPAAPTPAPPPMPTPVSRPQPPAPRIPSYPVPQAQPQPLTQPLPLTQPPPPVRPVEPPVLPPAKPASQMSDPPPLEARPQPQSVRKQLNSPTANAAEIIVLDSDDDNAPQQQQDHESEPDHPLFTDLWTRPVRSARKGGVAPLRSIHAQPQQQITAPPVTTATAAGARLPEGGDGMTANLPHHQQPPQQQQQKPVIKPRDHSDPIAVDSPPPAPGPELRAKSRENSDPDPKPTRTTRSRSTWARPIQADEPDRVTTRSLTRRQDQAIVACKIEEGIERGVMPASSISTAIVVPTSQRRLNASSSTAQGVLDPKDERAAVVPYKRRVGRVSYAEASEDEDEKVVEEEVVDHGRVKRSKADGRSVAAHCVASVAPTTTYGKGGGRSGRGGRKGRRMPEPSLTTANVADVADTPSHRVWIVRVLGFDLRWFVTEVKTANEATSGLAVHQASLWVWRIGSFNVSVPVVFTDLLVLDPEEEKERARSARRAAFRRWVWYCLTLVVIALSIVAVVLSARRIKPGNTVYTGCHASSCEQRVRHSWWWSQLDMTVHQFGPGPAHDVFLFESEPAMDVRQPVNFTNKVVWSYLSMHQSYHLKRGDVISVRATVPADNTTDRSLMLSIYHDRNRRGYEQNLTAFALEGKTFDFELPERSKEWNDDEPEHVQFGFYIIDNTTRNKPWPWEPVPLNWSIAITGHTWEMNFTKASTCRPPTPSGRCVLKRTFAFRPFHGHVVLRQNPDDDVTHGSGPYSSYQFHFTPRVLAYTLLYGTPALLMLVSVIVFLSVLITKRTPGQWWWREGKGTGEAEGSDEEREAMLGGGEEEDDDEAEAFGGGEAGL
ncbi:hypothetical protein HK101_009434 [Irineochytrium annulatum]|nr:hypothetical protein HK101_009434 [Irineochytrium annulatum]